MWWSLYLVHKYLEPCPVMVTFSIWSLVSFQIMSAIFVLQPECVFYWESPIADTTFRLATEIHAFALVFMCVIYLCKGSTKYGRLGFTVVMANLAASVAAFLLQLLADLWPLVPDFLEVWDGKGAFVSVVAQSLAVVAITSPMPALLVLGFGTGGSSVLFSSFTDDDASSDDS
eukprot:TRINITY_DN13892_c0_g1_i3.p1 TRINITY_DN13892_c0_g1~~TRINITY_DN13892_c0_g1_i3.p1  ORF type:complete len:173 (+),score=27.83 TRINITY_DN13892_c0_g1_i3:244-762(+)